MPTTVCGWRASSGDGRATVTREVDAGLEEGAVGQLEARHAVVTVNGAGDVSVHASDSADLTINGVGDIDLFGKPAQFTKSVNGLSINRKERPTELAAPREPFGIRVPSRAS